MREVVAGEVEVGSNRSSPSTMGQSGVAERSGCRGRPGRLDRSWRCRGGGSCATVKVHARRGSVLAGEANPRQPRSDPFRRCSRSRATTATWRSTGRWSTTCHCPLSRSAGGPWSCCRDPSALCLSAGARSTPAHRAPCRVGLGLLLPGQSDRDLRTRASRRCTVPRGIGGVATVQSVGSTAPSFSTRPPTTEKHAAPVDSEALTGA